LTETNVCLLFFFLLFLVFIIDSLISRVAY
jgi:hypothetical protein